jgi:hypothetical protein
MLLEDKSKGFLFKFAKLFIQENSIEQDTIRDSFFMENVGYSDLAETIFSFLREKGVGKLKNYESLIKQSEFFFTFIKLNENIIYNVQTPNLELIQVPSLKIYTYEFEMDVRQYKTEIWQNNYETFLEDPNQVADTIRNMRSEGDLDPYSGDLVYDDIYDTETTNEEIKEIKRIS